MSSLACSPKRCDGCLDRVVCRCLKVTESQVVDAIQRYALQTVQEIRAVTGAGDGCTCCHRELRQLLDEHAPMVVENAA